MGTDQELLIPVGHDIGVLHSASGARAQQVRVGLEVAELADQEFALWLLAHGVDDQERPTRKTVVRRAGKLGLPADKTEPVIERFLTDGLLATVDPEQAEEFAKQHQLFPLLYGLGADADQPWLQTIGLLDQPVLQVSNAVYDVWSWTHLAPELWTGCHDAAKVAVAAGVTTPEETDPRQVLAGVLGQVHGLLAVRAAYFDRRRMR